VVDTILTPTYCYLWAYKTILFYLCDTLLSNTYALYRMLVSNELMYDQVRFTAAEEFKTSSSC
jgi:hypothetical protein